MNKLTNKYNLPQAIVDAVKNDGYTKGTSDFSVTELLKPPRIVALEKQHQESISEDASDRIWSLLGQSIHTILERANKTAIAERRLSIEVEGSKVSGGMDLYDEENGILTDYKVTSVWKVIKGEYDEWEKQLNVYSLILSYHNHNVRGLKIIAILRDWSKMEAERNPSYPKSQVAVIELNLWSVDEAYKFLRDRIVLHKQARVELPLCSSDDRWAKPDIWAVMKKNRKSAVKLCTSKEEAEEHLVMEKDLYVAYRPGVSTRCRSYCAVSEFCVQYQKEVQASE